jgi:putative ABC transport system permease protein
MSPERALRWLLRLLPFDLRTDHGREMEQVFRAEHREARAQGRAEVIAVWWRALRDVARTAPREHAAQLGQDAGYALRMMRRSPGFTAVAVLTLALGIGVNSAIFSLVHAVLLAPLPYGDPGGLVAVWNRWDGAAAAGLSDPELLDYQERSRGLEIAAMAFWPVNLGAVGEPERLPAAAVTTNVLRVLGVRPALGRDFAPGEEQEGRGRVAILAHGLWVRRFDRDPAVVGRTIQVNGEPFEVVGVAPAGFLLPSDFRGGGTAAQMLVPLSLDRAAARNRRGGHYLQGVGRLAPGASLQAARAEMGAVVAGLVREYPDQHKQGHFGVALTSLRDDLVGPAQPVLAVLLGAVALVLLLACANLASLLLARGESRRRELAVRASLGADRFRLLRQMLTETCVLGLVGGGAGLAVAALAMKAVLALDPATLPRAQEAALSWPVLAFTLAASLGAGIAFGLLPATQVSRAAIDDVLREAGRSALGGRGRLRRALVAVQVAIALVLLVGAGLLVKSFGRLQGVASGFEPSGVLTFRTTAPPARYPGRADVTAFYARVLDEVRAVPGVRVAGAATGLPLSVQSGDWGFDIEGRASVPGSRPRADWFVVTPGYFEALEVGLRSGRRPASEDADPGAPVLFLNESAARGLFPGEDPVGRRVRLSRTTGDEQPWRTIAGVMADVRQRGLERPPRPEMYIPLPQFRHFLARTQAWNMVVVAKTTVPPRSLAGAMRAAVRRVDPEVPTANVHAMEEVVAASLSDRRRDTWLIGAFAALALAVAAVGVYGVTAYQVAQRRREIGLRVALGAERRDVVALVLAQGMRLAAGGIAIGVPAALLATGALRAILFEVTPHDATVFLAIPSLLAVVVASACALPAARAARIDAAVALRDE